MYRAAPIPRPATAVLAPSSGVLQAKRSIDGASDKYEEEADRIAEQVVSHHPTTSASPVIGRHRGGEESAVPIPSGVDRAVGGGGRPLEPTVRHDMEKRLGHDFSQVRVHSDEAAAQSAREVHAHAYTFLHHIVFGTGHYAPASATGRRLIAHELTHVVQQGGGQGAGAGSREGVLMREAMSREDIEKRMAELNAVINDLGFTVEQRQDAMAEMGQLTQLLTKGGTPKGPSGITQVKPVAAGPPPLATERAAVLDIPRNASLDEMVAAMRAIDALKPSDVASNLFVTKFKGQPITLTGQQVERVRNSARKALGNALDAAIRRRDMAVGRYRGQEQTNSDFPIASAAAKAYAWVSTFGSYSNPAESVQGQADIVSDRAPKVRSAIAKGSLAEAIRFLSEADAASERTSKIVTAYIDQLLTGAEGLATTLEYTRDAAFLTVGVLAVVVTGGAALGLEAGVVGTGVGGLTVAQTATVVSVGAPIFANLGVAGMKLAAGDPVEWDRLVVETAVQIILAKFGGRLGAGIAGRIAGNPATQTLARQAIATLVSGAATHVLSQSFTVTVSALFEKYRRDKNVTWGAYVDALAAALSEPTGWFMVMLSSGVHLGAEVKVANAAKAQAAATAPVPVKPATPATPTTKPDAPKSGAVPPEATPATPKVDAPAAKPTADVGLSDRGVKPAPGSRTTSQAEWKAQQSQQRWEKGVDTALDKAFGNDAEGVDVPRVKGGPSNPRIGDKRVPGAPPDRMDIEDIKRKPGETQRQAVARVRTVIGRKLSDIPALAKLWSDARSVVVANEPLTAESYPRLYENCRKAFWRRVRGDSAEAIEARRLLADAGFVIPKGKTSAPIADADNADLARAEKLISLDHDEEKAQPGGWQTALDAENLRMEFAQPNTERENKQARHPELR